MLSINDNMMRYNHALSLRGNYVKIWDDLLKYFMPRRTGMYDEHAKAKDKSVKIYDGTPGGSLLRLAAVLNSTLTNQATNWYLLETDNDELNEMDTVAEWLEKDRETLRNSIENSNFYQQIMEFYIDLCGLATATMYAEESKRPGQDFYFSTRHLREVAFLENDQGEIDTVYMCRTMTAYQIMDRWKDEKITGSIPDKVKQAIEQNKPGETFDVVHAIYPNDDYKEGNVLNPLKFKYATAWIFKETKTEITRSGYHELPAIIEFWSKTSGDIAGRGPAWDALADVKSLYSMKKSTLRVGQMVHEPPIFMPHSTQAYPVQLRPGGLTYFDPTSKHAPFPMQMGAGFPIGREMINDERNQVRDWFYTNQMQLIDAREMTAEEVRARMMENAKILGPTFGRLNNFLDRLFVRLLGILRRRGKLAPVPDIVVQYARERGTQLKVKFVSPIVKSASLGEVQGIIHTSQTAIAWAKETQRIDILDNLDFDYGIRKIADLDGAPPEFLKSEKDIKAMREQRVEQNRKRAEIEQAQAQAGAVKTTTEAQSNFISNKQKEMSGGLAA